jgi:hypothetical protein
MKVTINHNFTQDKALICAERIIKSLTEKYKDEITDYLSERKDSIILFSLKARGMKFKGSISVDEKKVIIESRLPVALKVFEGLLEKKIIENAEHEIKKCI